jgi:hypothetical protein
MNTIETKEIRELTAAELDEVSGAVISTTAQTLDAIFKAATVAAQKVG